MIAATLATALLSTLLVVVAPQPAAALHQHCGDDLQGTYSLTNGHPDLGVGDPGWSGNEILQEYARNLQAIDFTKTVLADVIDGLAAAADLFDAVQEDPADAALLAGTPASQLYHAAVWLPNKLGEDITRIVLVILHVANIALTIAETVLKATQLELEFDVADEDACGGTLAGDTTTMLWVATVQGHLASAGPPLAILMAPHDPDTASTQPSWPLLPRTVQSDFAWCPDLTPLVSGELPAATPIAATGGDCSSSVQLGFLDAPDLGVQAIVTNTIAHLIAHGVDVRGAESLLEQADTALDSQRYSDAFHLYRAAYQTAMAVTDS